MLKTLMRKYPTLPYASIEMVPIDYQTSCSVLAIGTIASLTPLKYRDCNEALGGKLAPLLSVKKVHEPEAYYSAVLIANRQSDIRSLDSPEIHTLYLVDPNSVSGYVAPLHKLFESGIIAAPSIEAVKARGWHVEVVGRHPEVISRVQRDENAIGAVGTPSLQPASQPDIIPLLRYYNLPQDVIVVSDDLQVYKEDIEDWFTSLMRTDESGSFTNSDAKILENSSAQITGVVPFSLEEKNAIADIGHMRDHVIGSKTFMIPANVDEITVRDLVGLVTSLKVGVLITAIMSILTALSSAFGLGYQLGRRPASEKDRKREK
jgi:hypothetical protein